MKDDRVVRNPHPRQGPPGTKSQYIRYFDANGEFVADVHQYLRPDGSLGASGRPDPKRMVVGDELWIATD